MRKNDLIYLDHILQSLSKVVAYVEGISYDAFLTDEEKQDAVIRKIEVCGEATKRVSLPLRQRFAQVPWRAMAGMRDKLIQDYFDVDLDTVWKTATMEIPLIVSEIERIIAKLEQEENIF